MRIAPAPAAALVLALLSAGCSRLENVGKPPELTPPGRPDPVLAPVAPERIALATPRPGPRPEPTTPASLWRNGPTSLFGDRRAQTLGDILTVVIQIDDRAKISNATSRSRTGSEQMNIPALLGLPSLAATVLPAGTGIDPAISLSSTSSSDGTGSVDRSEKIELRIAATVTDILPNGHMVIRGTQEIRVNNELRDLQVTGVIRPEDISRRNEIPYDRIAEARIVYGGRGQLTDVQQPRYGQQVVDILMPF